MIAESEKRKVLKTTKEIISYIEKIRDESKQKAILARLRNSINKPLSENFDVLPFLFEKLPGEFLGTSDEASPEEKSILSALQLYALSKQGKGRTQNEGDDFPDKFLSFGASLRTIREGDKMEALDRRFNAMITSDDFSEWVVHLRHLVKLIKSSEKNVRVDYPRLAEDLFWIAKGYKTNVKLQWSRDYYRMNFKGEEKNEK